MAYHLDGTSLEIPITLGINLRKNSCMILDICFFPPLKLLRTGRGEMMVKLVASKEWKKHS